MFLILGMGVSGLAAAQFLRARGEEVVGLDRQKVEGPVPIYPESWQVPWEKVKGVVTSPGVFPSHPILIQAKEHGVAIYGEVELALRHIPVEQKGIAITGTNGKTTVTAMTAHVLQELGLGGVALGNIGEPLIAHVHEHLQGVMVLELSSFQLQALQPSNIPRVLNVAAVLNITPNHLDRHADMEEYVAAKMRIIELIRPGGAFYIEESTWLRYRHLASTLVDVRLQTFNRKEVPKTFTSLLGVSPYPENLWVSYLFCQEWGVSLQDFMRAVAGFRRPSHRLQFVREVGAVHFYDDSKGTNVEAVVRAVEVLGDGILLIAGGVDKGTGYACWKKHFPGRVKGVLAIGQAACRIQEEVGGDLPVYLMGSLQEAVAKACSLASPGDKVLLSPGCASFDSFKNYAERGQVFQELVSQLCEQDFQVGAAGG